MAANNNVAVILPLYDEDENIENARHSLFLSHPVIKKISENLNVCRLDCNGKKELILPKGLAVRNYFFQNEHSLTKSDIIMLIDGTGKIDYNAVEKVKDEFEKDEKLEVIFGDRGEGYWGISNERKAIELFENYVIKKGLENLENDIKIIPEDLLRNDEFKDCQCGCWAFRSKWLNLFRENLSAYSYEIELNIFAIALRKKLKSKFIDVEIACYDKPATHQQLDDASADLKTNRTSKNIYKLIEAASLLKKSKSTNFVFKDNLQKLICICGMLDIKSKDLATYMTEFFKKEKNVKVFEDETGLKTYNKLICEHFYIKEKIVYSYKT